MPALILKYVHDASWMAVVGNSRNAHVEMIAGA